MKTCSKCGKEIDKYCLACDCGNVYHYRDNELVGVTVLNVSRKTVPEQGQSSLWADFLAS